MTHKKGGSLNSYDEKKTKIYNKSEGDGKPGFT
jgi:hypothetical protein